MITPDMIPDEVVAVAKRAWANGTGPTSDDDMEAAITAALNAWPKSYSLTENDSAVIRDVAAIILPLHKENTNGEG